MPTQLITGITQLAQPHAKEGKSREPLSVTENAALLIEDGIIVAAGPKAEVCGHPKASSATAQDLGGRAVIPGLVDSHTHVVFAGSRMQEMAMRTRGETYESIAKAGGGIVRSVDALERSTVESLIAESRPRIEKMVARGTTTIEIKTGYGLKPSLELKQLSAIQRLREELVVPVYATVLAHVVPADEQADRGAYVEKFCGDIMEPAASQGIVSFCDVFVERGAFTRDEAHVITQRATSCGLEMKLHVDQLHDGDGAAMAAELGALSADHLEFTSPEGARALAEAGVVATILPGCGLFLGGNPWPDGRALRDSGCEVGIATDCNPGSSMVMNLPLCATLAATQCGLSLEEALWGVTRGGAVALGLSDRGTLSPGERADLVVMDDPDWRSLLYYPGAVPIHAVMIGGEIVAENGMFRGNAGRDQISSG